MTATPQPGAPNESADAAGAAAKVVPSAGPIQTVTTEALFAGQKELFIDHAGERYRLRITRRNKLILQK